MPAATRSNGEDGGSGVGLGVDEGDADTAPTVTDHLDRALTTAQEQGMAASELMGLLFYYAHCVAEGHRQDVLAELDTG